MIYPATSEMDFEEVTVNAEDSYSESDDEASCSTEDSRDSSSEGDRQTYESSNESSSESSGESEGELGISSLLLSRKGKYCSIYHCIVGCMLLMQC